MAGPLGFGREREVAVPPGAALEGKSGAERARARPRRVLVFSSASRSGGVERSPVLGTVALSNIQASDDAWTGLTTSRGTYVILRV
jgi:hypothetical protein